MILKLLILILLVPMQVTSQTIHQLSPSCADSITVLLDNVGSSDQYFRNQMNIVADKFGGKSTRMLKLLDSMKLQDSLNTIIVTDIVDKYGWLGSNEIGVDANRTLFMVIQHSNLEVQKKYLPVIKVAVQHGKAKPTSLALLEDRIALREGRPQIYGTQVSWNMETNHYYVLPLIDPDNVNIRREKIGMISMEGYLLECCGLIWDAKSYKNDIQSLKQENKN